MAIIKQVQFDEPCAVCGEKKYLRKLESGQSICLDCVTEIHQPMDKDSKFYEVGQSNSGYAIFGGIFVLGGLVVSQAIPVVISFTLIIFGMVVLLLGGINEINKRLETINRNLKTIGSNEADARKNR